jgi:hypothetical protein
MGDSFRQYIGAANIPVVPAFRLLVSSSFPVVPAYRPFWLLVSSSFPAVPASTVFPAFGKFQLSSCSSFSGLSGYWLVSAFQLFLLTGRSGFWLVPAFQLFQLFRSFRLLVSFSFPVVPAYRPYWLFSGRSSHCKQQNLKITSPCINFEVASGNGNEFFKYKNGMFKIIFDRRGVRIILNASQLSHPSHFSLPATFN